jgi:CNT family concentrative nucleoside transporter
MKAVMGTSGAETLSASANVFMGQTEAPLIVKPYVKGMTRSELLALMVGGMATISGGVMAVFIQLGADAVAILAASVMAAPCGLYLAKLLYPEAGKPQTLGRVHVNPEVTHRNAIDAASGGASDGLHLALNVAAMLIAFLALLAMADYLLGAAYAGLRDLTAWLGLPADRVFTLDTLTLRDVFAVLFAPVAFLMGVVPADIPGMADLLGTKLVLNEFVAYVKLTDPEGYRATLDPRTYVLATYALAGFANVASIGIQIGGIGGLAPERRADLARLGTRALLGGFLATLINACVAAVLM